MKPLRISLITPSFNQGPFIGQTIESVLQQRGDFELEYLVLDGGSTDGTLKILRGYGKRLCWTSEPDGGQVDALNKGLRAASGDIVGWLNSDDLLAPDALQRVAVAFASQPALEWLYGGCDIIDARNRAIRRWITAYKNWYCWHYSYTRLLTENFISQMTVFWQRRTLDEIGYLDPMLKLAFDYDLWLRLGRRSEPFYIPERQASFRWYQSSKSGACFKEQFREDYAVALRYAPERRWLLFRKRVRTWRTLAVYRAMSIAQGLTCSGHSSTGIEP